jgi:hypothetical protein
MASLRRDIRKRVFGRRWKEEREKKEWKKDEKEKKEQEWSKM